jgi:hypothetical protein
VSRQGEREPELAADRKLDRWHRHELAFGFKGGGVGDGRIDAHGMALALEVPDQSIERLVGALPQVIVIA